MRKWRLPLTYQPKIEPVLLGTCRQTIRMGRKKRVGDLIKFYLWTGRPYRSKQVDLTEYEQLKTVINITITPYGFICHPRTGPVHIRPFSSGDLNCIAKRDGIVPPTGLTLRSVLMEKNGNIPEEGMEAQILRW